MNKVFVIIVVAVVFVVAIIQDRQNAASQRIQVQGIDNVVSAQLFPAHAGAGNTFLALDVNNVKDREVITKVLNWLRTSKYVGEAKDQFFSLGGSPTTLSITFKSGEVTIIENAVGSVSRKVDKGVAVHSTAIQDQVTVFVGKKPLRIVAPELKAWIERGWEKEEAFQFAPEDAVAKVLQEHPDFPATAIKNLVVYEDIGGVQGHKQPVTLTIKIEKRGQLNYLVTLTKDYNLRVGDKEAVQYWVYSVDPNNATLIDRKDSVPAIK